MLKARPKAPPKPTARSPYPDDGFADSDRGREPSDDAPNDLDADVHHLEYLVRYQHVGPPNCTLTMTQGQTCTYTQEFGGNQFAGTVNIPKSGEQQVIMNLWAQSQNVDAQATLIIRSFSYTPSD